MSQPKRISLANLGGGELAERVDHELAALCENIADVNVKAEAVRELAISIKVRPDARRQVAEITCQVRSRLPSINASKTTAFIAMEQGELGLFGMDIRQGQLPLVGEEPTVTEIRPVGESKPGEAQAYAPPMTGSN